MAQRAQHPQRAQRAYRDAAVAAALPLDPVARHPDALQGTGRRQSACCALTAELVTGRHKKRRMRFVVASTLTCSPLTHEPGAGHLDALQGTRGA